MISDSLKLIGFVVLAVYMLTSLWLFLSALVQLHLLWHFKNNTQTFKKSMLPEDLPLVSIQLPVYNEKFVIERLLEALAGLDYPKDRFHIQVMDDSTDETSDLIDRKVKELQHRQIDVEVIRRGTRTGFKAGALQHGLPFCKGDLVAIFDADFKPDTLFLKNLVPYFSDPKVGLVQARWAHLNREENHLTRIQTFLLDTHFSVEQLGRYKAGYFINFCGTAGIWRRQCIVDAGGWDGNVLSEDLDLSYRAQLRGWKLIYDRETEVPAELPAVMEAFKIQQFRWTKGMAQISKKNMMELLQASLPFDKKLHGVFHLLSSWVFVCLFINGVLSIPLLVFRNLYPEFIEWTKYTLFSSVNLIALTLIYYNGTQEAHKHQRLRFLKSYPLFLMVYMGLSVQNAIAVLQGFFGKRSVFVRTPKLAVSSMRHNTYLQRKISWINIFELVVLCYFMYGIALSFYWNDYYMLLFFMMIGYGLVFLLADVGWNFSFQAKKDGSLSTLKVQ